MANSLQQLIIERIQREGPLTFAEYMRMALYEPVYGYYVSGPAKMGWQGDYFTSTDVSSLFANCMGRQLYKMWELLKRPAPFIVLEQGAGRGHLAKGVQEWASNEAPDFKDALEYQTEDIRTGRDATASLEATNMTQQDEKRLDQGAVPKNVSKRPSLILSNELIDAFPVHIVETRKSHLYEIYITVQDGHLVEVLGEPETTELATYLDQHKIPWQNFRGGWRAEINLDALRWMQQCAQLLQRGFLLTIDYGDKAASLYTPDHPLGTLASYYQHQFTERPLVRPGEQDITAHVNFSALISEGRRHGLRLHKYTTQRLWLEEMGISQELDRLRSREFARADSDRASNDGQVALLRWYDLRQRVATLTNPRGMGNFKVLIMRR